MFDLRNSIFATILYYNSFNLPLTFAEIWRYLISPVRFSSSTYAKFVRIDGGTDVYDIREEIDKMVAAGLIGHKNGFYFLPGRDDLYEKRIEKDKLANKKWTRFLAVVKYLQFAPYLRAVFASGSLAANNPESKSDFDVFVIIRSGRLYTGRLFLWLISSALGVRRGRFDVVAPDKLCFNHYLTDEDLELSHKGLYIAQSLANMKPVIISDGVLGKFVTSNKWANSYCYNFHQTRSYREARPNKLMLLTARGGEVVLNNFVGDALERMLRTFQHKRIKNNPATYESGGRIVFNNKELEFHPRSFEKVVIENYNNGLKKFGVVGVAESNSGLS